jgi:endoglucanase
MDYLSVIQTMNSCHGPAGDERQLAASIRHLAEPYADDITTDTLGNLIVHRRGTGPKVLFAAHMDSIGLIVTHIDDDGTLSFGKLGGVRPQDIIHTPFRFKNGVCGVVTLRPKADLKHLTMSDLYLDIGAKDGVQAKQLVKVGDTAVYRQPAFSAGSRLVSPYLDNRAGCAAVLDALTLIREHTSDLYFVFTVQEELGLRGSKTAAYGVAPDYGIVVDVTAAKNLDDPQKGSVTLGGGAAIKVMDSSVICHPGMVQSLVSLAEASSIPFQKDVLVAGGTDGGSIHLSRSGVVTGGISIPCRYIHSPAEMVEKSDVKAAAHLIAAFAQKDLQKTL